MACSKSKTQWRYDVFLNFRGGDTRSTFVSHLHSALSNAGIHTFIDMGLQKGQNLGPELLRAIEGSQIAIVVFSKSYAESAWCLDELNKIIECHRTYGQVVVPIFYDVDPSVVRKQTGAFGKAMEAVAVRTFPSKILLDSLVRWGDALTQVANFAGWDMRNCRDEAEQVKKIVNCISAELDNTLLSITEFPVGLDSRVKQVIRYIENQSNKVCKIGIWGMGGSGKTTTAKAIYNQIRRKFVHRSFIEKIRQVCEQDSGEGHIRLQEQLILDVLKTEVKVPSTAGGTTLIEERLRGKSTLIVLDDVSKFEQLNVLCGNCKWISSGSVLIVTCRDIRLLNLVKVDYIYKVEEMNENESLELFSWHAFREASPTQDFIELSRNVVAYCGGLPLALEVLGSYLHKRTKQEWTSVLSKLKRIPNNQVQEKLRISFDGLQDQMEKDIFLDICCFFIGKDISYVAEILNGCGLHADIGITILIEHGLVKVEEHNKIGMHDLLRDMGREIVRESSSKEPGKRSRLWFHEDVIEVLANNTGTKAIEGLSYFSKQLRWVCWQGFPLKYIPNNFYQGSVIAISLKHSNLKVVWKEPQLLECLKILNLSHSKHLTVTPEFSKLPNLEKLILKDCPRLCKVHHSIGDLRNLLLINLKDCTSLSNLPRKTYQLKSVKTLILSGCLKIDKLEEDIGQMKSLTTLIAENIAVKQVPFSIVRSKSIGYISLCGYEGLARNVFPSIIWSWMSPTMNPLSRIHPSWGMSSSLTSIDVQNNNLGVLAPTLRSLSKLRSVLLHCDSESQLSKELRTIMGDVYDVSSIGLEITSHTSQISKHSLRPYLIGVGSYQEVFNTLQKSISEGLTTNESCDVFLPGDNYPFWLTRIGEGHSVFFKVPEDSDCCMKGMTFCVVYSSPSENGAIKCLISVWIVNYTKCTIQIYKRDTVISFNEEDWQGIRSHLGFGDQVEIFVTFGHGLTVKNVAVYLLYDESPIMQSRPSVEPKENAFITFIKKILDSICSPT
ncbi:TMV resistance protein N, partial [Mucuna pruriens]